MLRVKTLKRDINFFLKCWVKKSLEKTRQFKPAIIAERLHAMKRREFIKSAGGLAGAALAGGAVGLGTRALAATQRRTPRQVLGKNVVLFMTDQERAIQHFPVNWEQDNLPGLTRLKRNGLSFERAFTNACMCSPARSTWMTGYFPAQHGVKYMLEENMPARQYPQVELPLDLKNIASVMSAVGYNVVYKGKWHCSKPNGKHWVPQGCRSVWLSALGPTGRRRQPRHRPGWRRLCRQRRPVHE